MVSEVDVYTWIAEYACRHRVADLLSWVFDESNRDAVSLKEISDICLIQALIWLAVVKDKKDNYKAAVTALDTLVDKAADAHCLEYFIRLSLGLRFKDVVHSLTEDVQLKLREHFPGGTFQIKSQYLKNVFTENESFDDFSKTVLVFVDYFTHITPSAIKELLENYHAPQSMFGTQLTESLKQLTKYLFDCLLSRHPLTKLENLVKQGVRKQLRGRPNTWSKLLVEKLSGVSELSDEHVRSLFLGMQLKKHIASCKDSGGPSKELQLYEAIVPSSVEHENDTQRHRKDENVCSNTD
ncbi:uncharacterized protein LOC131942842 isoform X2 [Physella acuta]|uniref:uncharacterized protein LOC131942842 isoform X2 n=1 Tax=Physella acuta TaxID=109671 RepID=UPI0027DCA4E2|nr:uncharacterized protein LOC131942842 isoform X2 [Physella acuta]